MANIQTTPGLPWHQLAHRFRNVVICGNGRAELEMTTAPTKLIAVEHCICCEVDGRHYDTDLPEMFVSTVSHYPEK